jgi:hypothetical protein
MIFRMVFVIVLVKTIESAKDFTTLCELTYQIKRVVFIFGELGCSILDSSMLDL